MSDKSSSSQLNNLEADGDLLARAELMLRGRVLRDRLIAHFGSASEDAEVIRLLLVALSESVAAPRDGNLPDDELLRLWRSVQGPLAELNGPLIRYAGLVFQSREEEVRTLRAQVTWQPIETAPKDARAILGLTWDGQAYPMWWNKTYPRWDWCSDGYHSGAAPRLTHWLPLPSAPTEPSDGCSQCGQTFRAKPCGFAHAAIGRWKPKSLPRSPPHDP